MGKNIVLLLITTILMGINIPHSIAAENTKSVIFFYSKTCSHCIEVGEYLAEKEKSGEIFLLKFENAKYPNLRKEFDNLYKVSDDARGHVPIIFIGKQYSIGTGIIANFDSIYKSTGEKDKNAAMNFLLESKSYSEDAANNKAEEKTQTTTANRKKTLSIFLLISSGIILLLAFIPKKKKDFKKS